METAKRSARLAITIDVDADADANAYADVDGDGVLDAEKERLIVVVPASSWHSQEELFELKSARLMKSLLMMVD